MNRLTELLDWLEKHIDLDHLEHVYDIQEKALYYQSVPFLPLKVAFPTEMGQPYPYSQAFDDPSKMLFNELLNVVSSVKLKDYGSLSIRSNHGTIIMPSLFGLDYKVFDHTLPWIEHVGSDEEVDRIIDTGLPDLTKGLGQKVLDTQAFFKETLAKYPVCQKGIRMMHPDLQGPFDIAHMIWGSNIYLACIQNPEKVIALLELVTETYSAYLNKIRPMINDQVQNMVVHWGMFFPGNVVLREDSAVNLSKEMYDTFIKPYDEKILDTFNGGSIHFCGRSEVWISSMIETKNNYAINFGQVPNWEYGIDFVLNHYALFKTKTIANALWWTHEAELQAMYDHSIQTGMSVAVWNESFEEAQQTLQRFCPQ